jgi:hypothetical protein
MAWNTRVDNLGDGTTSSFIQFTAWSESALDGDLPWTLAVDIETLLGSHKRVRLDVVDYVVSSGLEAIVAWHEPDGNRVPILALAGRGKLNFIKALQTPKEESTSGSIEVRTERRQEGFQMLTLIFDMTK